MPEYLEYMLIGFAFGFLFSLTGCLITLSWWHEWRAVRTAREIIKLSLEEGDMPVHPRPFKGGVVIARSPEHEFDFNVIPGGEKICPYVKRVK